MSRFSLVASFAFFLAGAASLALTLYLWFGDWPQTAKESVDHLRSVAENAGTPPAPLIGNVGARDATSLGGRWQAVIDPYDRAELAGIAPRAVEPESPSDLAEFSFRGGLELDVPGDWNTQDPRLVFYQGSVWYKREFDVESALQPDRRAFLYFGAANYRASVYLNGLLLGEHEGGFTPFNFEVGDRLLPGTNLLVVRVDSRMGAQDVPTATTDWLNFGGLTRDVLLVEVPRTFVRNYRIQLDGDLIGGWVEVDGGESEVAVSIPELSVLHTTRTDEAGRAVIEIAAKPERWSPDAPRLYDVEIRAGDDVVRERIGFRSVKASEGEILLNGEPVFLRGISIHEETPSGGGRAHSEEHARTLLGWALELGCNFVRLAHYTHNEPMVRVADELGLLVWSEVPVYWSVDFSSPVARERAERQLSEMIARDQNRASVVIWSVGNETPDSDERLHFMGGLIDHVRDLDSSRLVSAALLSPPASLGRFFAFNYFPAALGLRRPTWTFEVDDRLGERTDVAALNEYFGWYYSGAIGLLTPLTSFRARSIMLDNLDRIRIETGVDTPLVLSEFGAGARFGMHAPEQDLAVFSEEYQALVYRRQIAMLRQQDDLRGISPWILKDFRSPLRLYQGVQDYWNRKGLIDDEGRKKQAFFVLREYYRELADGTALAEAT